MNAVLLLAQLKAAGASVTLNGETVDIDAPAGVLTPALLTELRAHKPEIVALLSAPSCFDCRPTHPNSTACGGRPFTLGAVTEDSPARWTRAIHCPVCHASGAVGP